MCAKGTWSAKSGAETAKVCEPCPAGKWSPARGATTPLTCADCSPGTWSSTKGASSLLACNKCGPGKYSEEMAATNESTCTACQLGTYQPIDGASNRTLCIPCAVSNLISLELWLGGGICCLWCSSNWNLLTSCRNAQVGNYSKTAGVEVCKQCPFGTWASQMSQILPSSSR